MTFNDLPEFIIPPKSRAEVAHNFRTYAEQVAYCSTQPDCRPFIEYPYNYPKNKQNAQIGGMGRWAVLAGREEEYNELIVGNLYYIGNTIEHLIMFSLFAAEYLESLSPEEQP